MGQHHGSASKGICNTNLGSEFNSGTHIKVERENSLHKVSSGFHLPLSSTYTCNNSKFKNKKVNIKCLDFNSMTTTFVRMRILLFCLLLDSST